MPGLRFLSKIWLSKIWLSKIWPYRRARVQGVSMAPTFDDGDIVLVRIFSAIPNELPLASIVLIEREIQPGIYYIKRIQKKHGLAYWVEGDNRSEAVAQVINDSRTWGYIGSNEIVGKVLFRLKRSRKSVA